MIVAGIDGTRHGWIAAFWSGKGSLIECRPLSAIAEIETWPERPEVVAIDIPIGFPDAASRGGRSCETEVRRAIGPRRSSVFSSPSRQSLTATSYEAADLSMKRDFGAAADDILDACAVAWTASRVVEHKAIRLPNDPPLDGRGVRMEIWG